MRWVPIPAPLIEQFRAHRVTQATERLAAGASWEDWDLVFADQRGRPINPRRDWAEFKVMLSLSGVRDARPHDARHTAATLLLEQGVDISVVQEILGHASLAVTKRYAHVRDKLTRDAAEPHGEGVVVVMAVATSCATIAAKIKSRLMSQFVIPAGQSRVCPGRDSNPYAFRPRGLSSTNRCPLGSISVHPTLAGHQHERSEPPRTGLNCNRKCNHRLLHGARPLRSRP
ncbi:tyrosine-type recombinase/integrase [Kribbella sp. NPDC049174]|uniref:tyrosine-type recombinase/integrase n=1 Tax=Kribbella sp. NPDC049174 TaxID=3364112 RepID=UPI003721519B